MVFSIGLHEIDKELLERIKKKLKVGSVYRQGKNAIQFRVKSIKKLKIIFDHFDKYPLITDKLADYLLLKKAFYLFIKKEHLTKEGLHKFVAIKASMNWGLSPKLLTSFHYIVPVARPLVLNKKVQDPYWLSGFISAEGCLMVNIWANKTHSLGFQVILIFQLTQQSINE